MSFYTSNRGNMSRFNIPILRGFELITFERKVQNQNIWVHSKYLFEYYHIE